jgi:arginine/serine-rich splicing factor 1/9
VVRERGELVGEVDFATADEMRYAVRKLDDTEFRNPFDKCYIRVQEDRRGGRDADRSHRDHHRDSRRSRRSHRWAAARTARLLFAPKRRSLRGFSKLPRKHPLQRENSFEVVGTLWG